MKPRIVRTIAVMVGIFFCALGILHDVVNLRWLLRVAARGDIAQRLVPQLQANIAFAGVAIALPGVALILVAPALARGKRMAARVAMASGMYYVLCGVVFYLWQGIAGGLLIFSALGALVCVPLLLWRADFTID